MKYYILLIFLFFVVIYILQDKGIIPTITLPSLTFLQPTGCVGTWTDVGTCNIDRCDSSNIGRGLGKQRQDFVVKKSSENGDTSCSENTREVGCYIDNYIECVCDGPWTNVTSCPSRTDYSIPDEQFYKTQRKTTTKTTPGIICEERQIRCPRDCSGSFVDSECDVSCNIIVDGQVIKNTSGLVSGRITNTFSVFRTKLDGEDDNQNPIFDTRGNCPTIRSNSARCNLLCDVDCQGEYRDIETCQINRCDPKNNFVGLGTKRQLFETTIPSQNGGVRCPPRERIVDCSSNLYTNCVICPGEFVIGTTCKNVQSCNLTTGNGQREDIYVVTANTALSNCVTPGTRYVDCSLNDAPNCTCSYTYDPPTFADCRKNQIVCRDDKPICTRDFTIMEALPGGICPTPNLVGESMYVNHNDSCTCTVERKIEPWSFALEKCGGTNNQIPIGTRTRTITIKKTGGYTACKFPKLSPSETILNTSENNAKGGIDPDNKLFFKGTNDTFQTVEIEANFNSIEPNEIDKCVCEGPWTNVSSCPSRTDYSIPDNQFYKTQSRTTTKTTPGIICEERQIKCPRDCSGSFVYSACADTYGVDVSCNIIIDGQLIKNTTGFVTGTITNTFNVFKTKLDGEDDNQNLIVNSSGDCPKNSGTNCGLLCDVDCKGEFRDIETCQINKCDPNNNFVGLGKKRQLFDITQRSYNGGDRCPGNRIVDCSSNLHNSCVICPGEFVIGTTCKNVTSCNGSTGNGHREDVFLVTANTSLSNCVAPGTRYVDCSLNDAPNCTCSYTYDPPTFTDCSLNQIVCNHDSKPICTRSAIRTDALTGGVCPAADLVGETPDINPNHSCSCTVDRTIDPWSFAFERCGGTNNQTPIGSRIRTITVKKTGGYTACKFPKLSPSETIANTPENNAKGGVDPYNRLFFKGTNDTFQTFEIEPNFISTHPNEISKCV